MNYQLINRKDFKESLWLGGKTYEAAIFPNGTQYINRDFVWRLSSATVSVDSDFSSLEGYKRWIVLLDGEGTLVHRGVGTARLKPLEPHNFRGSYKTKSFGNYVDYNFIIREDLQGIMEPIVCSNDIIQKEISWKDTSMVGIFCSQGYISVIAKEETFLLEKGDQLVIHLHEEEIICLEIMGEGQGIFTGAYYPEESKKNFQSEISKERREEHEFAEKREEHNSTKKYKTSEGKPGARDFLTCIYLANSNFRGASFIFKKKKYKWIDEELSNKINKIEGFFLPFIVFVVGMGIIGISTMGHLTGNQIFLWLCIWAVVDCIIVTPIIYLIVLPKPINEHIKDLRELTKEERDMMEKEMAYNPRLEKLLKKYKYTGKARYDEDGNRLDKTY